MKNQPKHSRIQNLEQRTIEIAPDTRHQNVLLS